MHTGDVTVIALFSAAAVLTAAAAARPRWRRRLPKVVGLVAGAVLAAFLVGRGVAEFFIVHYGDPASYRNAWGGPSLAGVFAVHSGPAVAILLGAGAYLVRRHRARRAPSRRLTPDRLTPDRLTPDRLTPDRLTPDLLTPDLLTPDRLTSGPSPSDRGTAGRVTSGTGPSGTGPSGSGAGRDVRPLARSGGHR